MTFTLTNIFASCILDLWVRALIEALLQTADAESLLSSFRRMLRGVCDGEVLLDGQLKIFGESECVQHHPICLRPMSMNVVSKHFGNYNSMFESREPLPKRWFQGRSLTDFPKAYDSNNPFVSRNRLGRPVFLERHCHSQEMTSTKI